MLLAAKYEEIYPPYINDFSLITDKAYSVEVIRRKEIEILEALDFNLTFPTSFRFLERFLQIAGCESHS